MILIAVGISLFLLGVISARVKAQLGTILAITPLIAWFVVLIVSQRDGELGSAEASVLGASLCIGLIAFSAGANLVALAGLRRRHRGREIGDG